jgi:biotin transporter BioY
MAASLLLGDGLILLGGVSWLSLLFHVPLGHAIHLGFFPFVAGDIVKIVFVGLSLPQLLKVVGEQHE